MPLITSKSPAAFSKNVATEIKAGKPQKQAVAIAYAKKNEAEGKDASKQDEACRLFKAGKTVVDISQRLAVPENIIERWVGYIRAPNTWYGKTKDSLPLPIAVKKAKLAAHNAGLTEAQDGPWVTCGATGCTKKAAPGKRFCQYHETQYENTYPYKKKAQDFSRADEDAYFKRRKEIQTKLDRERPNDDTNRLRAHEQTLRERGEKVTPYRVAAEDSTAYSRGQRVTFYNMDNGKEESAVVTEPSDTNDAYVTLRSSSGEQAVDKQQIVGRAKDASPSETLEDARKAEVAQDHACALDAYRAAAHSFRQVGDQRSEQVARDGIAACQRQAAHGYSDQYEHPSRGKVQAFDSAERALESAVERTRAGENVALESDGGETVVAPVEDARSVGSLRQELAECERLLHEVRQPGHPQHGGNTREIEEKIKDLKYELARTAKDALPVPVCDESTNAPWICPYDGPVPTRKCPYCGYDCKKNTARDEHEGFVKLEHSLAHRKGITDPDALAASIGRKKYGAKGMAGRAEDGFLYGGTGRLGPAFQNECNSTDFDLRRLEETANNEPAQNGLINAAFAWLAKAENKALSDEDRSSALVKARKAKDRVLGHGAVGDLKPVPVDDDFKEADHPHGKGGKFGSGSVKAPTSQATLAARRASSKAAKEKSVSHKTAAYSTSHSYSPEEEGKLRKLFGKDALPKPAPVDDDFKRSFGKDRFARANDKWVTVHGTHIEVGKNGEVDKGPAALKGKAAPAKSSGQLSKAEFTKLDNKAQDLYAKSDPDHWKDKGDDSDVAYEKADKYDVKVKQFESSPEGKKYLKAMEQDKPYAEDALPKPVPVKDTEWTDPKPKGKYGLTTSAALRTLEAVAAAYGKKDPEGFKRSFGKDGGESAAHRERLSYDTRATILNYLRRPTSLAGNKWNALPVPVQEHVERYFATGKAGDSQLPRPV